MKDHAQFQRLHETAGNVFALSSSGLPSQVFGNAFSSFRFRDADRLLGPGFWPTLQSLAAHFGDRQLAVMMLDPDPVTYYYQHFARFGALKFDNAAAPDVYVQSLQADPGDSPADAFYSVAQQMIWFGDSAKWGLWAERNYGVGIAAVRKGLRWPAESSDGGWLGFDEALGLISQNFRNGIIPPAFVQDFSRSYANGTCAE